MQVESGRGRPHVEMFAEWCGAFYDKGMGGDPHLMFPAIAEAELFADLEQVLHVGGPLLAPSLADGGEHEVRVAAHALVVEVAAPLGEHLHMRATAAALDLHPADHLVDHGDAVVARAAALAGVAVVAVPERVVLEQGDVAVEGATGHLAR